jgi:predicted PurR-regulated permease PerM/uncharacterized protein YjbJ (UPF0337 family)
MNQEEIEAMYKEAADMDRAAAEGSEKEVEGAVEEATGALEGNEQQQTAGAEKKAEGKQQRLLGSASQTLMLVGRNILKSINTKPAERFDLTKSIENEALNEAVSAGNGDAPGEDEQKARSDAMARNLAKWRLRRDVPLAILAWLGVFYIVLMSAQHIGRTLLVVVMAALMAYVLTPAVALFERIMPRFIAISVVYLIVLGGVGGLLYMVIQTAVQQFNGLYNFVNALLQPGAKGQISDIIRYLGIQTSLIESIRQQVLSLAPGAAGSILPFVTGVLGTILDIILVTVLSIYFLIDGRRFTSWLRYNAPRQQRGRVGFALDTLQRIVGGYIRGQILLCTLISVLVGVGMQVMGVPYALLLGVLSFILEFIPILGTLASGLICVLLALTKGWVLALIVLIYFIVVHIIEGDIVGPRIVGKSIGLHPIVAMAALIAGGELFGVWGALFASPIAGVLQAFLITVWIEWKERHAREFQTTKRKAIGNAANAVADRPLGKETTDKLPS